MADCLFCKIVNGDIPASIVYQDDRVIAFNDIKGIGIGILNALFYGRSYSAGPGELSIPVCA